MIIGVFLCAWLILWQAPDTSLGRLLQRWMLDRPIARAARITPGQITLTILLLIAVSGAVWLLRAEAAPILGLATPDIVFLFASVEVTSWVEAITGALLIAAGVRWRDLKLPRFLNRRPQQSRQRRTTDLAREDGPPANDDERPLLNTVA